jgi:hypothetical protein
MFDLLKKYEYAGHFFFSASDDMEEVCNAPADKAGVYLVYMLRKGKIELVYIGSSGTVKEDGKLHMREGGLKERIRRHKLQYTLGQGNGEKQYRCTGYILVCNL